MECDYLNLKSTIWPKEYSDLIKERVTGDIFTHLYNQKDKYKKNKDSLSSKYKQAEKPILTNPGSYIILNQMKDQVFIKLFEELDSDQDNIISRYCLNTNGLNNKLKRILNPIITELKQDNETLNKDEFIKAMSHLFEMLSMEEKNYILHYYRNRSKAKVENHSRRSSLSNKSKILSSVHEKKMMRSISEISIRNSIDSSAYFRQNNENSRVLDGK
jgi:hypothetical protein